MKPWFRGKIGGAIVFLAIATLVGGGLAWVTADALRLEKEQLQARAQAEAYELRLEDDQRQARVQAEFYEKLRLALWKLDSRISPVLAREDSRPYNHYSAVYAPSQALFNDGRSCQPGTVLEPSPLLHAELPDWILLHFQTDEESGWASPQILSGKLAQRLEHAGIKPPSRDAIPKHEQLLAELSQRFPPQTVLAAVRHRGLELTQEEFTLVPASSPPQANYDNQVQNAQVANQPYAGQDYLSRRSQQNQVMKEGKTPQPMDPEVALGNTKSNGQEWFTANPIRARGSEQVSVSLSPMVPLWLKAADGQERLVVARLVQIGKKQVCQGMVLDWPRLQTLLAREVEPLFPQAQIAPVHDELPPHPERAMTALPVELDPGMVAAATPAPGWTPLRAGLASSWTERGWTPLRVGLASAWVAALVALLAVGLGGWSLLALSERRIRFVSAVTHELRTPLTTLRLYLDMLASGMVKDETKKADYLHTLNTEADRLNRLVANVLHFSRLENQRPPLEKTPLAVADLLEQVRSTWQGRCQDVEKELVLDNAAGEAVLVTDHQLVQQVLGNLIDNACKYSRGAEDRRIWLRARRESGGRLVLEVEDRGPGVPTGERRTIFRAFRRGQSADVTAGGVGLGLALARRWTRLLGGRLTLHSSPAGACFRVELATTKDTARPGRNHKMQRIQPRINTD